MTESQGLWLGVTGDLMLNRSLFREGAEAPGPGTIAAYDVLRRADIGFVNLEVALTDRGVPADKLVPMRADPALAAELVKIGCDVATVANNHAMDFGSEGMLQTLEVLDEAGIARVGGGANLAESLAATVVTVQDIRVAFIGLSTSLPPGFAARKAAPGIAPIKVWTNFVVDTGTLDEQPGMSPYSQTEAIPEDVERACDAVRRAAAQADLVVVGIHWGVPYGWMAAYQGPLSQYQQPLAHAMVDAGASIIVGNHAHVLHGMELYKDCPIFYSLGNFMFHMFAKGRPSHFQRAYPPYDVERTLRSRANQLSCIARIRVTATGVDEVEIVPIVITDFGEPALADEATADEIVQTLDEQSRPLGAELVRDGQRIYLKSIGCGSSEVTPLLGLLSASRRSD